jgi:hypothetical protein
MSCSSFQGLFDPIFLILLYRSTRAFRSRKWWGSLRLTPRSSQTGFVEATRTLIDTREVLPCHIQNWLVCLMLLQHIAGKSCFSSCSLPLSSSLNFWEFKDLGPWWIQGFLVLVRRFSVVILGYCIWVICCLLCIWSICTANASMLFVGFWKVTADEWCTCSETSIVYW